MVTPLIKQLQEIKRQAILAAARATFTEHGFSTSSMDAIARAAGVGKGTVYDVFASKEELLLACCMESCHQDERGMRASGAAHWTGFPAALDACMAGLSPDLSGLPDPIAFGRGLLLGGLLALLSRPGIEGRMFLDLVATASKDAQAHRRVRQAISAMLDAWERLVAALLAEGIRRGRIRPTTDGATQARLLMLAFDGLLLQQAWGRFANPEAEAHRLVEAFFLPLEVPAS